MAYQRCAENVIAKLKLEYTDKIWNKNDNETIFSILLSGLGKHALMLDEYIFREVYNEVYKGLTISDYKVPLTTIDIDPSLRQFNEYDKDYFECEEEQLNNEYNFNLPDLPDLPESP